MKRHHLMDHMKYKCLDRFVLTSAMCPLQGGFPGISGRASGEKVAFQGNFESPMLSGGPISGRFQANGPGRGGVLRLLEEREPLSFCDVTYAGCELFEVELFNAREVEDGPSGTGPIFQMQVADDYLDACNGI